MVYQNIHDVYSVCSECVVDQSKTCFIHQKSYIFLQSKTFHILTMFFFSNFIRFPANRIQMLNYHLLSYYIKFGSIFVY